MRLLFSYFIETAFLPYRMEAVKPSRVVSEKRSVPQEKTTGIRKNSFYLFSL